MLSKRPMQLIWRLWKMHIWGLTSPMHRALCQRQVMHLLTAQSGDSSNAYEPCVKMAAAAQASIVPNQSGCQQCNDVREQLAVLSRNLRRTGLAEAVSQGAQVLERDATRAINMPQSTSPPRRPVGAIQQAEVKRAHGTVPWGHCRGTDKCNKQQ